MWYKSATKLVLVMFSTALVVGLFMKLIDPKDFKDALFLVLAFYFGQKSLDSKPAVQ